jgi:signal transduction histidine kinase
MRTSIPGDAPAFSRTGKKTAAGTTDVDDAAPSLPGGPVARLPHLSARLAALPRRAGRMAAWQAQAVAVALLLLLAAATLWMWRGAVAETHSIAQERFDFKLAEAQFAIQQRLLAYQQILRGGVALFAARGEVSRGEWRDYVHALQIERNFPGIQGIGYVAVLQPGQVAQHVRKVRGEGFPDYDIRPAGERPEYAPIVYMEPFDWRNLRAFGHDMHAEPALHAALLRARDSGLPAASGKVRLAQETADGVQSGFVLCLPVYDAGRPVATPQQRHAALHGHVCSPFRMRDLMQGILGPDTLPDIRLQVFDGGVSADSLMYDSLEGAEAAAQASFGADRVFEVDGRPWTLRFAALPEFDASIDTQRPRLVLASGLLVSVLLSAVVWALLLNRRRARQLAAANGGLQAEIDERTKLAVELKRARHAAEAANQAKSDFLANVSHELRTPLTLILAPLEQLLAAAAPGDGWRTQLARAQRNALLLMNRVNDILDFSKAEAGKFDVRCQTTDLVQVVGVLAGDAAEAARQKGSTLTWQVDPALTEVGLDLQHFEKIALNLMGNAIKFTPAQGTIQVHATVIDGTSFEFSVQDSGIGIAADKLPMLFERFSQVDTSATRHYGGTGIGLALVKELVALMGGTVGVESEAARGSRFFVRLPRGLAGAGLPLHTPDPAAGTAEAPPPCPTQARLRQLRLHDGAPLPAAGAAPPADAAAPPQESPADPPAPGPRARVLVVDDSPEMLAYISELLQDGCDVATAGDGEQAWALLQRLPADLVVSDVMMPVLDGFGLTARIKASACLSHLPVILLTARGGTGASVSGLQTGADDYIAKPFSPAELKARVHAALRMVRVQAELRDKSHQAGMAQIATNVLHNVGNVLNSVNVSAGLISGKLLASKLPGLGKAVRLMNDHAGDLGRFMALDEKGRQLPIYLDRLAQTLAAEQQGMAEELSQLTKGIDHIREIVATQQSYAGADRVAEPVPIGDLVDDALRMNIGALARHQVTVVKQFAEVPLLSLDRHRMLLILINLISNAKYAMDGMPDQEHQITLQVDMSDDHTLRIRVADNGQGIAPGNMTRIFAHGFTTRKGGHGFGLHSCALAAKEMGGRLTAHSDGPGRGAAFVLEVPVQAAAVPA